MHGCAVWCFHDNDKGCMHEELQPGAFQQARAFGSASFRGSTHVCTWPQIAAVCMYMAANSGYVLPTGLSLVRQVLQQNSTAGCCCAEVRFCTGG